MIQVEATRIMAVVTPDSTPLQDIPGLKLRQQGRGNPQSDLSIRGSSFNSTGLTLNGLSIRNAQSEHWHASLTVPAAWLEQPYVLTGMDLFRLSSGHPAGSVGLNLAPIISDEHRLTIGGGNFGNLYGGVDLTVVEYYEQSIVGSAAFLNYHHADQTDGYKQNDLDRIVAGARVSRLTDKTQADLMATIAQSQFGARGFYGASPGYPAEEELWDAMALGSLRLIEDPENPAALTALWRRTDDSYWLDRHNHAFYQNQHITDFFGLHGDHKTTFNQLLGLDSRADLDLETIKSRSLGNHHRSHASLALIPNMTFGRLQLSTGGSLELFSADSPRLLPAAGIEWSVSENHTLFINYTESLRQPSYTELNYKSPDSLGNSGLSRQHTRTTEAGYKGEKEGLKWQLTGFYEYAQNTVDWIKAAEDSRWSAENLETIESIGVSALGHVALSRQTELSLEALLLDKNCETRAYASRYALDYPELSTEAALAQHLTDDLTLMVKQELSQYRPNPARAHSDWSFNSSLEVQWRLPTKPSLALSAGISNLLDDNFQIFPGQETIGRAFHTSLTYSW
ncbi:MAG: TonB-dependent receptor [Kiritimatiellae bacterium]|nr:TonB-dependent receptor [Kiritimatiellia bacterium]